MTGRAAQKAESIKLVALDVDGVMTAGVVGCRGDGPDGKASNQRFGSR